jgi:eukaryotic-like serine/threonine-protein kinase
MNYERRKQVEDLFEAMLELGAAEREARLDQVCAGDAELLAEVQAMLAANALAEDLFENARGRPGETMIGPYRVLRELGRGGMGVVYLAERADGQYRRRVAIKLIPTSRTDDPLHQRFIAERQILAGLDHPNIARLLDGGLTADGRPYLVLEHVDGIRITEHCDRHRLSIEQRLRLFLDVCAAVHHAHQNLIIHRDLKPGNILVAPAGQVRLLDFGIAKLVNPALGPVSSPVTRTEFRLMTPEYASPEQVRGDSLTTVSDIYSLGVLLYELLTGSPPYRLSDSSPVEILQTICDRDPERPSTRVMRVETRPQDGQEQELTPALRGSRRATSAEQLRRQLAGDLDSIVLMALRKEPARRYTSADMMAEDIVRYLEGRPVLAHQGSRRYQLGKLARRHRGAATAVVTATASLTVGLGAALWQAQHARLERDRSEVALAETREIADFLMGMFEASDPTASRGVEVTARDLLERGMQNAGRLADQPVVQARMFHVMGRAYRSLGQFSRADSLISRALEMHATHLGPASREVAEDLASLAELRYLQGSYSAADSLYLKYLAMHAQGRAGDNVALGAALRGLANVRMSQERHADADSLLQRALAVQRTVLADDDFDVLTTQLRIARLRHVTGDYDGAEAILLETLARQERTLGEDHPAVAHVLIQLAGIAAARDGDYARAESLHRRALAVRQRVYRAEHPAVATSMLSVAAALSFRGKQDEAEPLYREAIAMQSRLLGPTHPDVASGVNSLGLLLLRTGRHAEAEAEFHRALSIYREVHGDVHSTIAMVTSNLGRVARARGRLDRAEDEFRASLDVYQRALGVDHPFAAAAKLSLAQALQDRGSMAEAERLLLEAESHYLSRTGTEDELKNVRRRLAELYENWPRPLEASRLRELARAAPRPP